MIFTPDGKVIRDIEIEELYIFFGGHYGKRINLTKDKITCQNTVSSTVAGEDFPAGYFDKKEIPLSFDSFLKISDDIHNAGLLSILQPQTLETVNYYPGMSSQGLRCVFTDGSCYNYMVRDISDREFENISRILLSCFEPVEAPAVSGQEVSANENEFCETLCCKAVILKKWSYCPVCGKYLHEEGKNVTTSEYDVDATVWICEKCNSGVPDNLLFCANCGAKRPW